MNIWVKPFLQRRQGSEPRMDSKDLALLKKFSKAEQNSKF